LRACFPACAVSESPKEGGVPVGSAPSDFSSASKVALGSRSQKNAQTIFVAVKYFECWALIVRWSSDLRESTVPEDGIP